MLGIDGAANVIRRWRPGGAAKVVAGSERGGVGSGGDGGPATSAKLRLFEGADAQGIVALPDGGFRLSTPATTASARWMQPA